MATGDRLVISLTHPTLSLDMAYLAAFIESVCEAEGYSIDALSVVLSDHATVRTLNRFYLAHDHDTDVLAFPLGDDEEHDIPRIDGEIYVDLDTARERHADYDCSFDEEVARYVVHGLLHLMNYTDKTPEGRAAMRDREEYHLQKWCRS